MILTREAKGTLTPIELDHGDTLRFILRNGCVWEMTLLATSAEVVERSFASHSPDHIKEGNISVYAFDCDLRINGREVHLRRCVGSQESFYEPYEQDGARLWFDAASAIFEEDGGFMDEKDWRGGLLCKPYRKARFAVQDAGLSICPEPLALWYPTESGQIDIRDCYNGQDCWMGPYAGAHAHCGLDVNMPAGTLLYAPISFDDQYYYNTVSAGFDNNRWRGIRRWPDGSEWWLQSHHLIDLLVPERAALARGSQYATSAGVAIGAYEHTHFVFQVLERGGSYFLDPWIILWEAFRQKQRRANLGTREH